MKSVVFAVAVAAALAASAPTAAQHNSVEGTRIGMFNPAPLTIPASEASFVSHGWATSADEWNAAAPDERRELKSDVWRFELWASVNGGPIQQVPLDCTHHATPNTAAAGPAVVFRSKNCFVEFPGGTFAPGTTVVFTGRWYGDSDEDDVSELELQLSRTVVFS
jgi:hypothetical protein